MNYLVTLSFDLYGVKSEDYECIKEELGDLNLYETIVDDKGIEFDLPTTISTQDKNMMALSLVYTTSVLAIMTEVQGE